VLLTSGALHVASLRCTVVATYSVAPESVDFGEVDLDAPADQAAAVATFVFRSATANIAGPPTANVPWLLPAAAQASEGAETAVFARLLPEYLPWGQSTGVITVHTDDPTRPTFSLPVRVRASGAVRPIPAFVVLRPGESAKVRFVDSSGASLEIRDFARPTDEALSVSVDRFFLCLSASADFAGGSAIISVSTDVGTSRVLVVGAN
jgi:hypothetical protein